MKLQCIIVLVLLACILLATVLLAGCSSPVGGPDAFDQALGNLMTQRAAAFQARSMERSAR